MTAGSRSQRPVLILRALLRISVTPIYSISARPMRSTQMKKMFLLLTFFFAVIGCKENVEYLPGFTYSDSGKCYIEITDQIFPLISYLVNAYGEVGKDELFISEIRLAVERGCDINEPDSIGISPLNAALLYEHYFLVQELLELGGNPHLDISSKHEEIDGRDSFEFSILLLGKSSSETRIRIDDLIQNHK